MEIKIEDGSNDKKYFTVIPNYILNHSSAIDKAVYIDMKRAAGENGLCFMTEKTLCKRNDIGRQALHKSLKYLMEHKWIEFVGITGGKTRPIKTYKINDIWKENNNFYENEKIVSETALSTSKEKDSVQNSTKIVSETALEEEPYKEEYSLSRGNKKFSSIQLPSTATEKLYEPIPGDKWEKFKIEAYKKIGNFK